MSTASGMALLMAERRRQVALMTAPLYAAVASIQRELVIYCWWIETLQRTAESTRYQLTYTPGP